MGMVVVAFFAANAATADVTTIRSTLRRTRSAASSGRRSFFCSANRYSMAILFPSIHPSLVSSCRNASTRTALPEAVLLSRKPMRGTFPACCARADTLSAKSKAQRVRNMIFFFMSLSLSRSTCHSTLNTRSLLLNHRIRSRQDVRLDRQADLLRGLEIDHQLELRGPLYGQIGGLGAFQSLVHVNGNASIHKDVVWPI